MDIFTKFCLVIFAILALSGSLFAQSFLASIGGNVKDSTGAVVPEANITVTEVATGIQRADKSNGAGDYSFPDLKPGTYVVAVSKPGFMEVRSSNIVLSANQAARFDALLQVGVTTQTIEVTALAPTMNTENAENSASISNNEVNQLPIVGRNTLNMIPLTSSIYAGDGSSYSLGGIRGNDTNFTIDGISSNSAVFGDQVGPMTNETLDAVGELKTEISNNSAEFPSVGTFMIATRSGTNQLHGDAFDIEDNWALNARSFFSTSRPHGPISHDNGADIGGPVVIPHVYNGRNKTFFHFTYEGNFTPGSSTETGEVPDADMLAGNFSELLPASGSTPAGSICAAKASFCETIKDPYTGLAFPGNIIGPTVAGETIGISQVSKNLQQFMFLAPNDMGQFINGYDWLGIIPSHGKQTRWVTRIDHQASSKDSILFRMSLLVLPEPLQFFGNQPQFYFNEARSTQNIFLGWTHSFSPSLLNEARIGFSRDAANLADNHTNGVATTQALGITGINFATRGGLSGFPTASFDNFSGTTGEYPTYFWRTQTWDVLDNLSYIKGKHNVKTGFLLRKNVTNISQCCNSDFGTVSFTGFATNFDYSDFLLGIPSSSGLFTRTIPANEHFDEWGFFGQDNWQVSSKLTVNLGLRWESFPSPTDKHDLHFNFDLKNGDVVLASQQSLQYVNPLFAESAPPGTTISYETASAAGMPARTLLNNVWNNFGPRIGFAYRMFGNNRTVLRAGWGIYYTRLAGARLGNFGGGPFVSNVSYTNTLTPPSGTTPGSVIFSFPDPFQGVASIATQSMSPLGINLRTPTTQQWNMTIEHQFAYSMVTSITYRGVRGTQIPYAANINEPPASTNPAELTWFRYPNFYNVTVTQDGAYQNLNAMDFVVERKFSKGITFHSGWTWAHNLTDTTSDGEGNGTAIQNPYDRFPEYGNVDFMPRHRWVSYALYDLPFGQGKRFGSGVSSGLNQAVGGWQTSLAMVFRTGLFMTPSFTGTSVTRDPSNTRTNGGRPNCIGNPYPANQSITDWLNPSAFSIPAPNSGLFGNCANDDLVGPGQANLDFGLFKYFTVKERLKIQLRMDSSNLFNHANFNNPTLNISSGTFGDVTSQAGSKVDTLSAGARNFYLGLRFSF